MYFIEYWLWVESSCRLEIEFLYLPIFKAIANWVTANCCCIGERDVSVWYMRKISYFQGILRNILIWICSYRETEQLQVKIIAATVLHNNHNSLPIPHKIKCHVFRQPLCRNLLTLIIRSKAFQNDNYDPRRTPARIQRNMSEQDILLRLET